jgi:hypothetical protein
MIGEELDAVKGLYSREEPDTTGDGERAVLTDRDKKSVGLLERGACELRVLGVNPVWRWIGAIGQRAVARGQMRRVGGAKLFLTAIQELRRGMVRVGMVLLA